MLIWHIDVGKKNKMLNSAFFISNRRKLSSAIKGEMIAITANGLMQRTGDTVYPFRQDSNFFYLTGINEPDILLVIDGGDEFLVLPKKSHAEQIFGGTIDCDEIAKISGITKILEYEMGWDVIRKLQHGRKNICTILAPPERITHTDSFFTNGNRRKLVQKIKRINPATSISDIHSTLIKMRQIKQPVEVEIIKKAIEITSRGLNVAKASLKEGMSGYMLKAKLDEAFTSSGADHGFAPIISSGPDTCVLHALNYEKTVKSDDQALFDIGAEYHCYTADISRTYFVGPVSERKKEIYNAVMSVHRQAQELVKPGLNWRDYVVAVDEAMGKELIQLGLIKNNTRENVRKYFSHAIGHSLGLDVHDPSDYLSFQEGNVFTIEPGIYIPEEGIGVRIEDDLLVTKDGVENLSAFIPYQ